MKVLNLKLKNFKGIRNFELDTQGSDINVYGDNAAGKTTLADSFMWLLFNKDSQNRSDFEIKTLGPDGEPEHGLEHMVEAILELEDGSKLALKKVYQEKWTKKKGSATAEFTGHTTDHFVDGVPVQKKEYDARIAEIADENIFRLLTDPRYFNEVLHWQKRRELLLEVCGDVSDEEVIASNAELDKLAEILGNRTIEQHRKVIQARRSEINKELEKIPVRIDEVQRNLPDISDISDYDALEDINRLKAQIQSKQELLAEYRAGGAIAEKTKELREVEAKIIEAQNKHRQAIDEKVAKKSSELSFVRSDILNAKAKINAASDTINYIEAEIRALDERMEKLRAEWKEVNAKTFEFKQSETCPTCGQALPAEQLRAAREKAEAEFNKQKAEKLEAINAEGKRLKEQKNAIEQSLERAKREAEQVQEQLAELERKEAVLKNEIDNIMQGAEPVESTPEYYHLMKRHESLREEIRKLEADSSLAVAKIQKEIVHINTDIFALEQAAARLETRKNGGKRIEELKAEERKLAAEYEDLEHQLYLTDEFIRTKVKLLEDKINSKFKMARFKLFNVLVNGGIEECCETTYNGVPYSNLNNGARLNIGLDIINTLAMHYAFAPVVFIDNAESVTDILPTKGQQIRLIVSAADKKLRVEIEEREELKEGI